MRNRYLYSYYDIDHLSKYLQSVERAIKKLEGVYVVLPLLEQALNDL